jgi:hypothetical protein
MGRKEVRAGSTHGMVVSIQVKTISFPSVVEKIKN